LDVLEYGHLDVDHYHDYDFYDDKYGQCQCHLYPGGQHIHLDVDPDEYGDSDPYLDVDVHSFEDNDPDEYDDYEFDTDFHPHLDVDRDEYIVVDGDLYRDDQFYSDDHEYWYATTHLYLHHHWDAHAHLHPF
jgi:hypothetical protein